MVSRAVPLTMAFNSGSFADTNNYGELGQPYLVLLPSGNAREGITLIRIEAKAKIEFS